jgi:hypothetical protein
MFAPDSRAIRRRKYNLYPVAVSPAASRKGRQRTGPTGTTAPAEGCCTERASRRLRKTLPTFFVGVTQDSVTGPPEVGENPHIG